MVGFRAVSSESPPGDYHLHLMSVVALRWGITCKIKLITGLGLRIDSRSGSALPIDPLRLLHIQQMLSTKPYFLGSI